MPFGASGVVTDVVESTSPTTLQAKIAASFAARLLVTPVSQLVEIALAGGGAGGVLQATIYYSTTEDTVFPPLVDQHVKVIFGSERKTIFDKLAAFYADPTVGRTTFVEKVAQGDGIQWVELIVYTLAPRVLLSETLSPPAGFDASLTDAAPRPSPPLRNFTAERAARRSSRLRKG